MSDSAPMVCANHPQRETSLRCNQCEKPICVKCAVLTPTGYRCKECVRGRQKVFETAVASDYFLAFFITAVLSFLGSLVVLWIGFLSLLLGPLAGTVIGEAVRRATSKRRSKKLFLTAAGGVVAGCLPLVFYDLFILTAGSYMLGRSMMAVSLPSIVFIVIYAVLTASTVYYRLSGIAI